MAKLCPRGKAAAKRKEKKLWVVESWT